MLLFLIISFFENFIKWLNNLSLIDFLWIFGFLIILDFLRSVVKCIILLLYSLYRKVKPLRVVPFFHPKITIIIPAHNEEKIIKKSIEAVLETDYENKEIIVVDDGSKDRTYELAYPYAKNGLIKLFRRDIASGSKAGALNFGLCFASGDVIVTIDADTLIERNSLKEIVKPLSDPNVSAVSGNVRVLKGEGTGSGLLVKLQSYEYLQALELGRRFNALMRTLLIISGAFGAFWRKNVTSLGDYDKDTITEDFDITLKMKKIGKKLAFAEKAISWTQVPERWNDWRRQRMRWTMGEAQSLWKHRNIFPKKAFNTMLVIAVYDMVLNDVILLFLRFAWFLYILFFLQSTFLYVILFSFILYLAVEFLTFLTAGILSPRKEDLKNIYLVPLMVFFYRPYYSIIRFNAFINYLLKKESKW